MVAGARPADPPALLAICSRCSQLGRVWVLATLGERWTTRIIVVPGETLVTSGPYRFVNHPNYLVVIGEIAVLPLVFGLWDVAIIFSLLNAADPGHPNPRRKSRPGFADSSSCDSLLGQPIWRPLSSTS